MNYAISFFSPLIGYTGKRIKGKKRLRWAVENVKMPFNNSRNKQCNSLYTQ
jgi:hypothetical protein